MPNNRSDFAVLNAALSVAQSVVNALLMFFVRRLFLNAFGLEILGFQSTFLSILSLLNLAELGFGIAISVHLYRPIVDNDEERICAVISIYKRVYRKIGLIILLGGLLLIPALPIATKTSFSKIGLLASLYVVQLLSTAATYLFADRRAVFTAYQKSYILSIIDIVFILCFGVLQILSIEFLSNYYVYYSINVFRVLLSNTVILLYANKKYSFITKPASQALVQEEYKTIKVDTKNVLVAKICGFVLNSTDGIIISSIAGAIATGLYSNYSYIFLTCQNMLIIGYSKVQPSLGNLIHSVADRRDVETTIINLTLVSHFIGSAFSVCACALATPLVSIWLGAAYILDFSVPLLFALNVYLYLMLYPMSMLFGALGYFVYDKKIVVTVAFINIVLSALLVNRIGIQGVLIGTTVSLAVYWIARTIILYKRYFCTFATRYLKTVCRCLIALACSCALIYCFSRIMPSDNWLTLTASAVAFVIAITAVNVATLYSTGIVSYIVRILKRMVKHIHI